MLIFLYFRDHARNIKIFVGNINDYTTEDDLWMVFEDYGEVTDVCIIKNYGFVVSIFFQ